MEKVIMSDIASIIHRALEEDIATGDVTTLCTVPPESTVSGRFVARESGVVAGLEVVDRTFEILEKRVGFSPLIDDGESVEPGGVIGTVRGPGQAVFSGERVALNFLQRMSGIATLTDRFVEAVKGSSAVILDTRKTAPGLRLLDKWAVRLGGGENHRFGLYDMVLIKENHIAAAGGIAEAVGRVLKGDSLKLPVEVEAKTLTEVKEAVKLKVDRIMLDNMGLEEMREAVRVTDGAVPLEASGNVTLENVTAIGGTGVDYISIGMLTHSVKALDITFLLDEKG